MNGKGGDETGSALHRCLQYWILHAFDVNYIDSSSYMRTSPVTERYKFIGYRP